MASTSDASTQTTFSRFDEVLDMLQEDLLELTDFKQYLHDMTVVCIEELTDSLEKSWIRQWPEEFVNELPLIRTKILKNIRLAANEIVGWSQMMLHENDTCAICLEENAQDPVYCLQCLKVVSCKDCMEELIQHRNSERFVKCLRCQRKSPTEFPLFYYALL